MKLVLRNLQYGNKKDGRELHNQDIPKKTQLQKDILKIDVIKHDEMIEIVGMVE